ncbi:MAG: ParB/RepB/Spo0J family partition protein [Candidatus Latescibacteria bacterium]|nr:ParB/RepB/Spo0J family partition protein [Candidatus Latescibacterota bacterium]
MAKRVLGRGLQALIPDVDENAQEHQRIVQIDIEQIAANPYQPRQTFDQSKLDELSRSIVEKGVIQPISVHHGGSGFELIAGERRLRAAKQAGFTTIPAIVMAVTSPQDMMELSLIENIQRDDLNPIHEAKAYLRLLEECQLTQEEVAARVGKNRSTVANILRLLRLPDDVQASLLGDEISMGHARALLGLENKAEQSNLCKKIINNGLSVRKVEQFVKDRFKDATDSPAPARKSADLIAVEEIMQRMLGTRVSIAQGQNKGKIEIEFYSTDDLSRILDLLKVRL